MKQLISANLYDPRTFAQGTKKLFQSTVCQRSLVCLDMDDVHRMENSKSIAHYHLITPCIFKVDLKQLILSIVQ